MNDARDYSICVRYSAIKDEEAYCATVKELPDVAVFEDSFEAAYEGALDVIRELQAVFERRGKVFPAPSIGVIEASGRITLRMSKSLHQRSSEAAQADDISLNQWLVEAAALRLNGSRSPNLAVINAPNAVSVSCNNAGGVVVRTVGDFQRIDASSGTLKQVVQAVPQEQSNKALGVE